MATFTKKERKENTYQKTIELFTKHASFIIADLNNVTAIQLQSIKQQWRGTTEILLGKNTVIKKALSHLAVKDKKFEQVVSIMKDNITFIFTTEDPKKVKAIMESNSRNTYAAIGMIAQEDVWIMKHVTSMGPERTKYFQALNISTQITKGKVEIKTACKALAKGEKVGPSQANLLTLLDMKPFTFFMKILSFYDGRFYEPWILEVDEKVVEDCLRGAVTMNRAVALGAGVLTSATAPFDVVNAYRKMLNVKAAIEN